MRNPEDDRHYLGSPGRRRLLRAGMGSIAAAAAGGLFGGRVAAAEPLGSTVPEVDKLAVRVVTDSYHHAFERSTKIGPLEIQRFGFAVSATEPPKRTVQNEWGLAWHIESQRAAETRQVLFDFAYTPETLLNNLALFGIDPSKLDAIALSHGHYDHFGGMVGFLEATKGKLKKDLPFYLGSEECFCTRELNVPGNPGTKSASARVNSTFPAIPGGSGRWIAKPSSRRASSSRSPRSPRCWRHTGSRPASSRPRASKRSCHRPACRSACKVRWAASPRR